MLSKLDKNTAFAFLRELLGYIHSKYNLIDKHRINKFMQLVRYLLKKGLEISQKKTDQLLKEVIFNDLSGSNTNIKVQESESHIISLRFISSSLVRQYMHNQKRQKSLSSSSHYKNCIFLNRFFSNSMPQSILDTIFQSTSTKNTKHTLFRYTLMNPNKWKLNLKNQLSILWSWPKTNKKINIVKIYTLWSDILSQIKLYSEPTFSSTLSFLLRKQEKADKEKQKKKKKLSKHKKKIIKEAKAKRK